MFTKASGGLNLINLTIWNKAAIAKTCWDLSHKRDKLWIRWIHAYYIRGKEIHDINISARACWMVRMILAAKETVMQVHTKFKPGQSVIRQMYLQLLGLISRLAWKCLMFQNKASKTKGCIYYVAASSWQIGNS